tara:strand:- start:6850 stop:7086 length:237 start_codon:yes stop_codon:yes gene_type:complete
MKENLNIYYDEEGDFLEINVGKSRSGSFKNMGDGIFERTDRSKKVKGIAIHGFKKRGKGLKEFNVSIPVKVELQSKVD